MTEMAHVGCRIPRDWEEQISELASVSGKKPSEIMREALAGYLGRNDTRNAKSAIASLEERVATIEGKLAGLGKLIG